MGSAAGDNTPLVLHNTANTTVTSGTVRLFANELALHPGPSNQVSIVRWTAPSDAVISINATFSGRDLVNGNTDVHVSHNGASLFDGFVNGFGIAAAFAPAPLEVAGGDTIDFAVGSNGIIPNVSFQFDSTGLDASITAVVDDTDNDGVPDGEDNCPAVANPLQENNDGDALGDVCDPDDDNDGVLDGVDNCPIDANPLQEDFDLDTLGNVCDPTFDASGVVFDIETLVNSMLDIIVPLNVPGGNGMIAKLTGKGGILAKVGNAVTAFGLGLIDLDTYVSELQDALAKVTAFDNQLAAKIGNGQIPATEGSDISDLSAEIRSIIELLITAVGG